MDLDYLDTFPIDLRRPPRTASAKRGRPAQIVFGDSFGNPRGQGEDVVGHNAIDIMGPIGLTVVSTTNGHVVREWSFGPGQRRRSGVGDGVNSGHYVVVLDSRGFFHHYAHMLMTPAVQPGQRVAPGQELGLLGNTGLARGCPHLHYQVRSPLNPSAGDVRNLTFDGQGGTPVNAFRALERFAIGARASRDGRRYVIAIPAA